MRVVLAAILTLGLAGCDQAYIKQPPKRYQGDGSATVLFVVSPDAECRRIGAVTDPGKTIQGCRKGGVIVLSNPCSWPNRSDYADTACHELGHLQGWPGDHPG